MRTKKSKLLSLFLVLCMLFTLIPVTDVQAASPKYYTVEKYDADGNGTMLVPPTETTNWSGRYGTTFITSLLGGSGNVTMSNDAVTGIRIAEGEWLNNDGNSKWYIATNYNKEVYLDSSYFYASDADVLRFIYVPNGDFGKVGMTTEGADWADALMKVEKGDLIKILSAYDGSTLGGNRKAAYDAGIHVILDPNATEEQVENAKSNMENASDSATSVTLSPEGPMEIYEGQKATLTATLDPGGSTDKLTWESSDDTVVAVEEGVIKGMKPGTATVTVTAENPEVNDSIEITVKDIGIGQLYISNMGTSNTIVALTQELTLMADIGSGIPDNTDWVWSVEDGAIAEVTPMEGNEFMASVKGKKEGRTNVIVTVGSKSASFEVKVTPYDGPYVYFEYADGREPQLLDENNTITLTCLDEGKFVVGRPQGATTWSGGNANVPSLAGGDDLQYWVFINSETGKWSPWDVRTLNMTVDSGGWSKSFKVNCVASGITELKTYVGEQEVTLDAPYVTEGTVSGVGVTAKGKNTDGEWVSIPTQALHYATSDTTYNFRWVGNQMSIARGGQATMSVFMKDNRNVKAQFIAKCNNIPVTGFTVTTPETFTITGEKDFMTGYYYGLQLYSDNLKIEFTPSNATNKELQWESLTPDIAFYTAQHNSGIVPKKAGTAKFKVTSADNSSLTQEVTVTFLYKNPLKSAVLDKNEYEMKVGDTADLNITTTPEDATDQSFTWSYDKEGIVEVKNNKIVAKAAGEVTVTGKANDATMGCDDLIFTVKVTGDAVEQDDPMPTVKAGIAHGLDYLENQSVNKYGDEWNIFTILRAGGTISDENKAAYIVSTEEAVKNGLSQPTDYARVILTLGVMGEDVTNFGGVDLTEKLYNWKDLDYQTSNQISWTLLALDSKKYEIPADAKWSREKLIEMCLAFQDESGGFCLTDDTDVDMTGMILQALAPYNNAEHTDVQAAFTKALTWLKAQMGTTAGFAANKSYNENSCTTAQVLTALSAAGMDAVDTANGFTIGKNNMITNLWSYKYDAGGFYWDPTVDTKANAMGTQQVTYALEAYRRLAEKNNSLYDLTDVQTKVNYQEELANLVTQIDKQLEEGELTESDYTDKTWEVFAQKLQIARTLLQSGSTDEAQLKEAAENLQAAIDNLEKKPESNPDLEAAEAFEAKVNALPAADEITVAQKETVKSLIDEYNGQTDAVKGYISVECVNKLNACADRIADLEAANAVIEKINTIGDEITLDSEQAILAARQAFDALTDTQKQIVQEAGAKAILEEAEEALLSIQNTAVQNVMNNIAQFADLEGIVIADKEVLQDVRNLYEQLPESLQAQVTNLNVLVAAEARMKELETANVLSMIENLKAPEELMLTDEEGNVTENVTADDITAIAQTKAAYDVLCTDYPGVADEIKTLEGGEALLDKLAKDVNIASQYESYIEAYLADMISEIQNFPDVDDTNITRAEELIGKYDNAYAQSGAYLDSIEGLALKVEAIRSQAQTVRSALNEAAAFDQLIEELSKEPITSDEMLTQEEAKLTDIDSAYAALSDGAKAYMKNVSAWNTAKANVNLYKTNKAAAQEIGTLIQEAQEAGEENLTDNSTVAAVKKAEEALSAVTKDVQAMVKNSAELEALKASIAEAKNRELAANGIVTIKETIPYDAVVIIKDADENAAKTMEEILSADKKAELKNAFTLEKYKIAADGSLENWDTELTAIVNCKEDLTGKQVYVLQKSNVVSRTRAAVSATNYLQAVVDGQKVTFKMDQAGVYAIALAEAASTDNNNQNNNNQNNSGTGGTTGGTTSGATGGTSTTGGSTTGTSATGSTKTPSGTSASGSTKSVSGSVPKTGDTIPTEMAATALMILAALAVLAALNKKRMTL